MWLASLPRAPWAQQLWLFSCSWIAGPYLVGGRSLPRPAGRQASSSGPLSTPSRRLIARKRLGSWPPCRSYEPCLLPSQRLWLRADGPTCYWLWLVAVQPIWRFPWGPCRASLCSALQPMPYLGQLEFSSGAFILLVGVTRLWVKVTCGKFNWIGMIWKGTHVLIKGPTADNAYQSKNQAQGSKELYVEFRDRFASSHASGKEFRKHPPQHLPGRPEHGGLCQGLYWSDSSVGRGDLPHGISWGGLVKPFKSRMPYWHPEESLEDYVNLALRLSGSAFRVELAAEPAPFTESAPEPAPFREPTDSAPEPASFREPTESAPEPAPFREPTESAPEPAPFRKPTESAP